MQIVSKAEAEKIHTQSLFNRGGTYEYGTFCKAKYVGSTNDFIGREVPDLRGVIAVYPVKQNGYVKLKSIRESQNG